VMCLDSMQRRSKTFSPPKTTTVSGSLNKYTLEVTEMEQAGYLVIITFEATGDGSQGALQRPEASRLTVDGYVCRNPVLGLRINMPGAPDVPGRFEGTLTFAMDGKCRSSSFVLEYGEQKYGKIALEFDPFNLTKLQKDVSRFLGGYLAKEWTTNGPHKEKRFEKQSARALVADVHQQENLNDCGVFVLENTLRSLSMKREFLKNMAEASPRVLQTYPWPSQNDITTRKAKLKAIVAQLFAAAAEKGNADVEVLIKGDANLRADVKRSLTDDMDVEIDQWSGQLQKELAKRQEDKDQVDREQKKRDEAVQARRDEERLRREREAQEKRIQEREKNKMPTRRPSSSSASPESRRKKGKEAPKKKVKEKEKERHKGKEKARRSPSSEESSDASSNGDRRKKKQAPQKSKSKAKRKRPPSSSRSPSPSSSPSGGRKRRR